ncbi:Tol-Pal system protein TolB [Rhodobacteraceae bacterium 2CG4]|uniref:Tol-Pal system protein TolB n=1 Tax=Halovulum marinum TaxID=2662447 RepID=A0A6L5YWQ9_9RHOB|nr:Tol-Pal system beta propeller repeat protein TolB [Halovulum marinum]MSU88410.1 Tol-Pal system protein TolB [Halovulum marinum]
MVRHLIALLSATLIAATASAAAAQAQSGGGPLRIEITEGVIEPLPIALPQFVAETAESANLAADITAVIARDLTGSGLFREVPASAHIGRITNFNQPVQYSDWTVINAQALLTGAVSATGDGRVAVKFRLHDVFANNELGEGQQFVGSADDWRRMAHKVADQVYSRLTGEKGYFDSKIVFVAESGPKDNRRKRLAVMDQDGADVRYLTDDSAIVFSPRWSPDNSRIVYTSYESGAPRVYVLDTRTLQKQPLQGVSGFTSAPRFSRDGRRVVYAAGEAGNSDIYVLDLASGASSRLTDTPAIETEPGFSPDGSQIVFESDRGGSQQIYVMPATGGEARRISFGQGRYGTPVWSPRGDLVAFTKMVGGRFHIGVMRLDGSEERLLTASFLDEGPTWAPNGRVIAFFRESAGDSGAPGIFTVDITGRNLKRLPTPDFASDPSWSSLLP